MLVLGKQRAGKELVAFVFVEPCTLNVEEFEAGHAHGERERVDRELRDGLVGARVGLVIKNVHGAVSNLQKVEMSGDRA